MNTGMEKVKEKSIRDKTVDDIAARLYKSSLVKGRYPDIEIDWDQPLKNEWGLVPTGSTLYGSYAWSTLTLDEQKKLTRYEMGSIMQSGIWFEMILQVLLLRDYYGKNPTTNEFKWAIREIEEECRHTLMFSRVSGKLNDGKNFIPNKFYLKLGKILMLSAKGELSYTSILIAEEILDVLQRANRVDENIEEIVRIANDIHVFEESRRMAFARQQIRDSLKDASKLRKFFSSIILAVVAYIIVDTLVSPKVYKEFNISPKVAKAIRRNNKHYRVFLKTSSKGLMQFLDDVGLINSITYRIYSKIGMI